MLTKSQKLRAKRFLRYAGFILATISVLLTPLVEFSFITNAFWKWTIYAVLVISVFINSLPNILNLIPERARHKRLRDTIIDGLNIISAILNMYYPAKYRACILMIENEKSKFLTIKYYSSNMSEAKDLDIKLEKHQGTAGTAWAKGKLVVSDLTIEGKEGAPQWGLSEEQINLTKELAAVLSTPIRNPKTNAIIAILSIDSTDKVADYFLKPTTKELAAAYANIFANVLLALDGPIILK
jgi:hypothetical protein